MTGKASGFSEWQDYSRSAVLHILTAVGAGLKKAEAHVMAEARLFVHLAYPAFLEVLSQVIAMEPPFYFQMPLKRAVT